MPRVKEVLLVQPPSRATTPRPPLGLMYVSASLSNASIENSIIDIKGKGSLDDILDKIIRRVKGSDSDIIGITCLVTEIEIVENMCRLIKEIKPDSIIVLGGAQPTTHPEHFKAAKEHIDYFVIGEGEITFPELVKALRAGKPVSEIRGIPGLGWFNADNVERSPSRELIKNMDTLPFPAYDKVDMEQYTRPTSWGARPIPLSLFWIFSSRGCPFRCNYCVAHDIFGKTVRQRSPKNVVDEIEYLVEKYKIDAVYFYDESFTFNSKRAIAICDEIKARGLNIVFGCQTRADLITDEVVKKMADTGCLQIDFGIESGSEKMLKAIRKDVTVEQVRKAIGICKKYGVRVFANMMVNLPGETEEDVALSVKLMKDLNCNVVIWNVTVPYPGGFLDRKLDREDYRMLMGFPSNEAYALLEDKYKFAEHNRNLKELVDELYGIFPHPRYLHFKLTPDYIRRWFLFMDFIFNPKYLKAVLGSKRKLQYITNPLTQPKHN